MKDHAWVHSSIVGWNSTVGRWVRMDNISVLGDDGEPFAVQFLLDIPPFSLEQFLTDCFWLLFLPLSRNQG